MQKHGFQTLLASSIKDAMAIVEGHIVTHAILDLRLEDGNGLDVLEALHAKNSDTKIVMLTGYGAIATAVAAMKLGAAEYLSKPSTDPDDILNALLGRKSDRPMPSENPMSADRVKWEHIQRVYEMCDRNVSETARQLNMHRRTLQRILAKRAPNE
ncbi:UNVERIFIED_CONTAM: hypothetical protein GTU68_008336 [Idotea baltica]|nr:hypothetical protein [Idotea baltica]